MSVYRFVDRHPSGVTVFASWARIVYPFVTFVVVTGALLATVAGGSIRGFEPTTDTAALEVAGRSSLAVVGYVDLGQRHVYVPIESLLLVGLATAVATRGGLSTIAGIALGACAAGGLVVVTGCPCGSGSATSLWQLLQ